MRPLMLTTGSLAIIALMVFSARADDASLESLTPGQAAWRVAELERREALAHQLRLNEQARFRAGMPSAIDGSLPPQADAVALDDLWRHGYLAPGRVIDPAWWYRARPSRIGYGLRQAIGARSIQTGANQWETRPVFAPRLDSPPALRERASVGTEPVERGPVAPERAPAGRRMGPQAL